MQADARRRLARSLTAMAVTASFVAGCGEASTESSSSGSTASSDAPFKDIEYDGPEAKLPQKYSVSKPTKPFTIGYQVINQDSGALAAADAAKAETLAMGGEFIVKADQGTPGKQVSNCNTLIAQGVDAIIVYPFDPKALTPCFDKAAAEGIGIVAQQTPPNASDDPLPASLKTDVLQGFDYAAYLRARTIAKEAPGSTYAYIGLAIPVAALTYAKERMKHWADRFGLKHVGDVDAKGAAAGEAGAAMTSLIAKYPDVENVFVFTVDSALAASTVAKASGKTDIRIIGYNGTAAAIDAIKKGTLFATVLVDVRAEGKAMADAAVGLINGEKLPKYVTTPNTMVTQGNAASVTPIG